MLVSIPKLNGSGVEYLANSRISRKENTPYQRRDFIGGMTELSSEESSRDPIILFPFITKLIPDYSQTSQDCGYLCDFIGWMTDPLIRHSAGGRCVREKFKREEYQRNKVCGNFKPILSMENFDSPVNPKNLQRQYGLR